VDRGNGKTLLGNGFDGIENDEYNVVFWKSETEQPTPVQGIAEAPLHSLAVLQTVPCRVSKLKAANENTPRLLRNPGAGPRNIAKLR
jgi:hypothetical protein